RDRLAAREVDRGQDLLVDPELDGRHDRAQAARALAAQSRAQARVHEEPAVRARQAERAGDGLDDDQAVAGIDVDRLDVVVADGARRLGQQAGDVERERVAVRVDGPLVRARPGHRWAAVGASAT